MAQSNNSQQIEQVARNMFQSQGRDFDKEFNSNLLQELIKK